MEENTNSSPSTLSRVGLRIILWSLGLSLIFFIPFLPIDLISAKGIVLSLGAVLGMLFWLLDSISSGRFLLPRGKIWMIFLSVIVVSIITSLFVSNPRNSFIGSGFDFGTISTLLTAFVYFFLFSVWGIGFSFTKYIVKTFFITGLIVVVFEIGQILFGFISRAPNTFIGLSQSNLIGSFNDLAIFLGAFVIMSAISIENKFLIKSMKIISIILFILSISLLFIINYTFVWQLVGLVGLALFIYRLMPGVKKSEDNGLQTIIIPEKKRTFSLIAFVLMACAFVGIIGANGISSIVAQKPFYFTNNESRPALVSTLTVLKHTYYQHPLTGAGMNRFNVSWEAGKAKVLGGALLASPYWDVSFTQGFGLFFTLIITLGAIASILFIYLLILFIKSIFSLFSKKSIENSRTKDLFIYGVLVLYTFFIFMFDIPNTALFVAIFGFWGMFLAYLDNVYGRAVKNVGFIHDSRHSFFSILSIMIGILILIFGGYILSRSFYANYLVNKASIMPANSEGILKSEAYITKAINISNLDLYSRSLTNVRILKIISILNDKSKPEEQIRSTLRDSITSAAESAKLGITIDPQNYQNYLSLLRVQEVLAELGNTDIYNDAITTADKALSFSPNNPGIIMRQAKLAVASKQYGDANNFIDKINSINPYYIDAYLLRSSILIAQGNKEGAFTPLNQAIELNPRNAVLQYQKGLLFMDQGNYSSAAESFENALRLAPGSLEVYASLAIAYEKLGNTNAIIQTLENAKQYVRDPAQINLLIEKAKNGQSISNTVNIEPESGKEKTVKEKTTKEE